MMTMRLGQIHINNFLLYIRELDPDPKTKTSEMEFYADLISFQ